MIVLPIGATAEPNTCGSCEFFQRLEERPVGQGRCTITLPPALATKYDLPQANVENSYQFDLMRDDQRCDLYRSDGKEYVVQRVVKS